jgi:hypothetical protein
MVAKCISDSAGDKQCEHFVACSFVMTRVRILETLHGYFFYVSGEFCLVEELSEVVPLKENQALMELFLNPLKQI